MNKAQSILMLLTTLLFISGVVSIITSAPFHVTAITFTFAYFNIIFIKLDQLGKKLENM